MTTWYSQTNSNWKNSTTLWNSAANGSGSWGAVIDNDTVIIQANHAVEYDEDMSDAGTWPNGIAGLTITSHATTPAMLFAKYSGAGTYHLKIKTGTIIQGTNAAAYGRLLANSDGVWGNTGVLPFDRKFIIDLVTTANITATYLAINLRCTEPTNKWVTTYGAIDAIDSVTGDAITAAGHGLTDTTPICFVGADLPASLVAGTVYYVRDKTTDTFKVTLVSGGVAVTLTDAGSGTRQFYTGHSSTSTDHMNILEDVTADVQWVAGAAVVLVDCTAPTDYDQQRLSLDAVDSASVIDLSANVDSAQYPGARVYLATRNIEIRSSCVTAVNIVTGGTSGYFGCSILSTAGQLVNATTFYGNGVYFGSGHTISGVVSGCNYAAYSGSGHTISGVVSGCGNGVYSGSGHTISGVVSGCNYAAYSGSGHTISGVVSGCSYIAYSGSGHTISGVVSGCNYGAHYGTGHTISGVVSGCGNGVYFGSGHTISGVVSGCSYGVYYGTAVLVAASLSGNTRDVYNVIVSGFGATLGSATQNGAYKYTTVPMAEVRFTCGIFDLAGVAGALGFWTQGGYCKSATYSAGTHGTPSITAPNSLVHEMTFEDNNRLGYVEIPVYAKAGVPLVVTMHGKLTGTSAWTTRPSIGIYDPAKPWQDGAEVLNASAAMASNTDWQTLTATYTPTYDRTLNIRMQGNGGTAGGTGTEKLYWIFTYTNGGGFVPHTQVIGGLSIG
jgi:hypothetical protein